MVCYIRICGASILPMIRWPTCLTFFVKRPAFPVGSSRWLIWTGQLPMTLSRTPMSVRYELVIGWLLRSTLFPARWGTCTSLKFLITSIILFSVLIMMNGALRPVMNSSRQPGNQSRIFSIDQMVVGWPNSIMRMIIMGLIMFRCAILSIIMAVTTTLMVNKNGTGSS